VSAQALPAPPREAAAPADGRIAADRPRRPMWLLLLGCLAISALSLLFVSAPTYDPWAWIIWGREITQWDLVTTEGPSWKPLPVLFTTPFALFGDAAAPGLWLVIGRAGGLLAFLMAYRLGARLAGPWAGAIAAVALLLADEFIRNFGRGNSEGLLVGLVLWAIERHLDNRRMHAFLLLFGASLLRPEVWPFWGLYGLWLMWGSRRPRDIAIVLGSALIALVLWFVPEYLGSGDWLRAADRARQPNPDSAAFAAFPFAEVFVRSASVLMVPIYVGGAIATVIALRRRDRLPLLLAAIATVLMVAVALMTEAGFAGNLRYVALPAALVCVLAGAGWVYVVRRARDHWGPRRALLVVAGLLALSAPFIAADIDALEYQVGRMQREADFYGPNLQAAIAKAGGEQRVTACGRVFTGIFQVPSVAWYLHLHGNQVDIFPFGAGTALSPRYHPLSHDPRYPKVTETQKWVVGSSCT
jgi:hypothetical protein